jgi:ATP-dependent Zn protease
LVGRGVEVIPYSEFEQLLKDNRIQEVYVRQDYLEGKLQTPLSGGRGRFITIRVDPQLADRLGQAHVKFTGVIESTWLSAMKARHKVLHILQTFHKELEDGAAWLLEKETLLKDDLPKPDLSKLERAQKPQWIS